MSVQDPDAHRCRLFDECKAAAALRGLTLAAMLLCSGKKTSAAGRVKVPTLARTIGEVCFCRLQYTEKMWHEG